MTRASIKLRGYVDDYLNLEFPGVVVEFDLEQPEFTNQGELSTNLALVLSKQTKNPPMVIAEKLASFLNEKKYPELERVEVATPGFVNFFLSDSTKKEYLATYVESEKVFEKRNEKVMVEYTDPNCFKVFHAGHLMSNTIGESLSRLYEAIGYDVVRVCYPSDIGRNVAIGVWGVMQRKNEIPGIEVPLKDRVVFLGECYAHGTEKFENDEKAKEEILKINQSL